MKYSDIHKKYQPKNRLRNHVLHWSMKDWRDFYERINRHKIHEYICNVFFLPHFLTLLKWLPGCPRKEWGM